jgi:hypothetical protein
VFLLSVEHTTGGVVFSHFQLGLKQKCPQTEQKKQNGQVKKKTQKIDVYVPGRAGCYMESENVGKFSFHLFFLFFYISEFVF